MSLLKNVGARKGPSITQTPIDVSSTDQTLTTPTRRIIITGTAGNLVCKLAGDSASQTYTGLAPGQYDMAIISITKSGTSSTGMLLF